MKELDQGSLGGLGGRDTGVVATMVLVCRLSVWVEKKEKGVEVIKELLGVITVFINGKDSVPHFRVCQVDIHLTGLSFRSFVSSFITINIQRNRKQ